MSEERVLIYCDHRERNSGIAERLARSGALVEEKQLISGDFVLGDGVVCERKTAIDFLTSLVDGRLFGQAKQLSEEFSKAFLVIEGADNVRDLYALRDIHPKAIRGAMLSLALDRGISVLFTKTPEDTADLLLHVAQREQLYPDREIRLNSKRKAFTTQEYQRLIIESLPLVGPKLAKSLLKEFGSVKALVNASVEDLVRVDKIGKKKAEEIKRVLEAEFNN